MSNDEYIALIEDYINGSLPAEQRREFEHRMAGDGGFRLKVDLHRQMQEHFRDAGRQRLRSVIAEVMQNPALDQPPRAQVSKKYRNRWKWVGLLAVILAVGFLVWKQSEPEVVPPAPASPVSPPVTEPVTPIPPPATEEKPVTPLTKNPVSPPIAQADPADFIPNRTMESNISGVRDVNVTVKVKVESPQNDADFIPGRKVTFKGTITGASENESFVLLIYNNRDSRKAKRSIPLQTSKDASGTLTFDFQESLGLNRGLYYFTVVEKETEVELYTGKFTIGKP